MSALFIILVSLTMTLFSEKVFISNRCNSGLMSYKIKKSWTDSTPDLLGKSLVTHSFFPDLSINNLAAIFLCRNIYRNKSRNLLTLPFYLYIMCFRTPQETSFLVGQGHGLRTPNEGKNQRNLKIRADVAVQ